MSTCNVEISNSFKPELQIRDTDSAIENKPIKLLSGLKGFQLVTTLVLELKKIEDNDETKYTTFYSNSKADTIINKSDINDIFELIFTKIISNVQNNLGKGFG